MIKQNQQSLIDSTSPARDSGRVRTHRGAFAIACLMTAFAGCQNGAKQQREVVHRDPVIPLTISRADLVDHLNQQNKDLNSWRCMSTRLYAKIPGAPDQSLSGYIACQSPNYFRLTADNLVVKADLGSNADHVWVYMKPGKSEVIKWKHEDTALLQQVPLGIPSIDPNWLMLVLGITPLNAEDYELTRSPIGKPELWLTAIQPGANGRSLRRVIKIDALQGVIREHAVYDAEANPLVRAQLSRHQRLDGHLIPTSVNLMFPQIDTELSLSFKNIEANPHLPDQYWHMPDKNIDVVDLGDRVRSQLMAQGIEPPPRTSGRIPAPRVSLQPPVFHEPEQTAFAPQQMLDGGPDETDLAEELAEPDWDTPISYTTSGAQPASYEPPRVKKRRWWLF
jgi:hypothetical protein